MKILVTFLMAIILVVSAAARENESKKEAATDKMASVVLSGTITDANSGESLVGVEVKLEGTDMKTYTDFDGNFSFTNVKPGDYKVIAKYISYKPVEEKLQANAKTNELKLKLQPSK